ncbi:hypothetical protein Taro_012977 [Colocasia esculenta]|uniref:Serine-threonine/tyrosine-protein kinase catalytic domain-containing protein n=1 Tax=Colocasia esculenta TaxID=4460 RepID=A0A843UF17_COLES|nr:hypothetical protein [Colocasia esculenta]
MLPDKTTVAVKRISNIGVQGKREFCTEIAVIGNIHHINLVKLRGFCVQGSKRLLVYEFMNRGSLDRQLFAAVGTPMLEWGERVVITLGRKNCVVTERHRTPSGPCPPSSGDEEDDNGSSFSRSRDSCLEEEVVVVAT